VTRILLIEDDPAALMALAEGLAQRLRDVALSSARDCETALSFLSDKHYDAVISDIRMSGLDGIALLRQVRERWPHIPVVLITGCERKREEEALYGGAFAFIEKPVDLDHLVSVIQAAMAKADLHERVKEANRQSLSKLY
jgi:two-component system, sensor histidine kinase and response regulator